MNEVLKHFTESGQDYEFWSPNYNMHFGYWRFGVNPANREALLQEMNRQVYLRLDVQDKVEPRVLDLGCGVGAPMRWMAAHQPNLMLTGCTIVPWQVAKAKSLTQASGMSNRVEIRLLDYQDTCLSAESYDSVYAIESVCHSPGLDKKEVINEAARIVKRDGRFVVADGFYRRENVPLIFRVLFDRVCSNWAVDTFAGLTPFRRALTQAGFSILEERDISWRLGPSALQIPWVTLRWLYANLGASVSKSRWRHIEASLLAPLVGLCIPWFCYKIFVCKKIQD